MKIAILAAGTSPCFPIYIDKPKSLYHFRGEVQLERVIQVANKFVDEKDIIIVGGYKGTLIKDYLSTHHPDIDFRMNDNYKKSAIFSLRTAIKDVSDDVVFMLADENISIENVKKIAESNRKMSILCHDTYYYYSVGIMKLRNDVLGFINDDCYLDVEYMKKVYKFAHNKEFSGRVFDINSGVCLGYTTIDLVRRVGNIDKIQNPVECYNGEDIDFVHYDPNAEYIKDVDHFRDTDEYKNSSILRFYSNCISDPLRLFCKAVRRILRKLNMYKGV